jgi:hypothetical protein
MSITTSRLTDMLQVYGLVSLGVFSPRADEKLLPEMPAGTVRQVLLIGNAGSAMWQKFRASAECNDGKPDGLDRWSTRAGLELAGEVGGQAVFPFDGPPYPPFLQWAARTGQVFASPVSLSIHRQYGLWHAYRFALLFPDRPIGERDDAETVSPCESCRQQPCLQSCPVQAFSAGIYRVDKCVDYLRQDAALPCRSKGCAARHSCPEAPEFHYDPEQARFHMEAFLKSRFLSST